MHHVLDNWLYVVWKYAVCQVSENVHIQVNVVWELNNKNIIGSGFYKRNKHNITYLFVSII